MTWAAGALLPGCSDEPPSRARAASGQSRERHLPRSLGPHKVGEIRLVRCPSGVDGSKGRREKWMAASLIPYYKHVRNSFSGGDVARRAGSADLPLHNGRVPAWLGQRMARLGAVIAEAIVHHYGRDEFLRRLAHPFLFQSFGAVMGMDWHSSGITTSVIGALKRRLGPLSGELGIHVCGCRGSQSRQTPEELVAIGDRVGFDGARLATPSRLVPKVPSAAVQAGY